LRFEIKKHSLFGIISLILAYIVIIFVTIEAILVIFLSSNIAPENFWFPLNFNSLFFISLYLTLFTVFFGIITRFVKKDNLGWKAILIGILFFILNWIFLFFVLSRLDF